MHLALGGCLKAPPVAFGITADTGGHIAYVLDAARAQALLPGVDSVSIVTRLFEDSVLGRAHSRHIERVCDRVTIDRIPTDRRAYLEKEALAADLPAFAHAFCRHVAALPCRPDLIHAHFADAAAVAAQARRRLGIPFVYTPHSLGIDKRAQPHDPAMLEPRIAGERDAIAAADAIIVSSRDEAERQVGAYAVRWAEARVHCIPPGVPQHSAGAGPGAATELERWLADPAKPIVLAIARPVRKKNLVALVRAYAATPGLADHANLVILAGQHDGRLCAEERSVLDELHALCGTDGMRGRVALPPCHGAADVAALYARAARGGVFVNPALHEPFGLTLIEAAAAGVPVVATCHGGPAEIVGAIGHGVLVDPRDPAAIGEACLAIVSDPARQARLGAAGRANVGRYDWARYAAASTALYASLSAAPRLLACDIDNTLTGCRAGARAFGEWRATRRMPFVVATGRSFESARAVLREWRLPDPDAFIVDVGTRMMLATSDGGWRECADYAAGLDHGWDRRAVAHVLARLALTAQPRSTAGPHKLSFFGTAADAAAIRDALTTAGLAARVVFSHDRLIDVLAPGGGKAAAVAAYAARGGLTLAQCIAAGDSGNDADLLEACGRAIVVGNAGGELAALTPRPGLHRAIRSHAGGVMEGLAALGLCEPRSLADAA